MTEKFRVRLFLNDWERDTLLTMSDEILEEDVSTMAEYEDNQDRAAMLLRLVFGKKGQLPIMLERLDEGTN